MIATIVLGVLTLLLAFATGISYARISHGFVRVFAFPRLQILGFTVVLVPFTVWLVPDGAWRWVIVLAQLIVIATQAAAIAQFTPLRSKESAKYEGGEDDANTFSILSSNVKMSNRRHQDAIDIVGEADPDIAIFMETDAAWCEALEVLKDRYPHMVACPLDNAYGMIVFSRFELEGARVHHLIMDDVPSVIATVVLRDGQRMRLYCIHPEPPVPYADSAGRDAELLKVAELVDDDELPSIVCGDLNDVAWSHTTRLFQRMSRMADPRVGRGFYNTFDARYWFVRWPLDHLFHDLRFQLVAMKRLKPIGSDHFPMYFKLALTPTTEGPEVPDEDAFDREEAKDIYADAEEIDRPAIGSDWEK